MFSRARSDRGFSLVELMFTVAVAATLMAISVPVLTDLTQGAKLNRAAREVEREMASARLKAVSVNRIMRVRFNCPDTGYFRTVEVLGTPVDTASNRCVPSTYPFPAPDADVMTRPNYDGPVRVLPEGATVTSLVLDFRPDGTVANVVSSVPQNIDAPVTVTVTRNSQSRTVTVNGAGKIQLQ